MELQPGQVNWGPYNPQPYPGAVRLWLYQSFGAGSAFVCAYRYRQPRFGGEQYHYGMVGPDGVTPSPGGLEYQKTIKEIADLKKTFKPVKDAPEKLKALKTAVLFKKDNIWEMNNQRQTFQWNANLHVTKYYEALKSLQAPVDFIEEDGNFNEYPFLVAPAYQMVDDKLVTKLTKYVEQGGNLILSCRFAQKDNNAQLWEGPYQAPLKKLAGIQVKFFDVLPPDKFGKVAFAGKNYEWNNWGEILEPETTSTVLATYIDQYYKNSPAIVQKKLGKGTVTYIGVETDPFTLEKEVIKQVLAKGSGRQIEELPQGLEVLYRDGLWFGLNFHSSENRTVKIPEKAKILLGERELKPCGVVVWTE